jgi:hypothetical protein
VISDAVRVLLQEEEVAGDERAAVKLRVRFSDGVWLRNRPRGEHQQVRNEKGGRLGG